MDKAPERILSNTPVICNHCTPTYRDSGANVQGSDLLSSPAVPGKCRVCDITLIYPRGIYYYKEQGYDSQQGFQQGCDGWSQCPRYSPWEGGGQWL